MADPREIGRQIGTMIADAKKQAQDRVVQAPVEPSRVTVEAPTVNVAPPAVTIETDAIAAAITEAKFDASDIVTMIGKAAETIAAVDLSGLQVSIERIDNRENIEALTRAVEIMSEAQSANAQTLAQAIIGLANQHSEQAKTILAGLVDHSGRFAAINRHQTNMTGLLGELLQAAYADRALVLDSDGNPIGVQIERRMN